MYFKKWQIPDFGQLIKCCPKAQSVFVSIFFLISSIDLYVNYLLHLFYSDTDVEVRPSHYQRDAATLCVSSGTQTFVLQCYREAFLANISLGWMSSKVVVKKRQLADSAIFSTNSCYSSCISGFLVSKIWSFLVQITILEDILTFRWTGRKDFLINTKITQFKLRKQLNFFELILE